MCICKDGYFGCARHESSIACLVSALHRRGKEHGPVLACVIPTEAEEWLCYYHRMNETSTTQPVVRKTFVAKAIYGLVTILSVLQVMGEHIPSAWSGAATLFGTTLAVALIDTYAETIAVMLSEQRRLNRHELREIWHDVRPVLVGSQPPTIVFILSGLGLFPVERAINIAHVVCVIFLFSYGVRVGQILHQGRIAQLLSGVFLLAVAALIVSIKVLFH